MERATRRTHGGDYDPGTVAVDFAVVDLETNGLLCSRDGEIDLAPFVPGFFGADATREELQEIVFRAAEKDVCPSAHTSGGGWTWRRCAT